jgi:hypothetical protein
MNMVHFLYVIVHVLHVIFKLHLRSELQIGRCRVSGQHTAFETMVLIYQS